ncbi:unnamed protein product [Durusdinium trenchii]|uniref:Uncharacterized protein n=2 Tax=Durusdinium trenchii TaxID=1381693 RepID=A0ABP0QA43_9DINO
MAMVPVPECEVCNEKVPLPPQFEDMSSRLHPSLFASPERLILRSRIDSIDRLPLRQGGLRTNLRSLLRKPTASNIACTDVCCSMRPSACSHSLHVGGKGLRSPARLPAMQAAVAVVMQSMYIYEMS